MIQILHVLISRKSLILLAVLGLAALGLTPVAGVARPICECAPLGGEFCGSDGKTYDSPCMAACFGATIVHSGPC